MKKFLIFLLCCTFCASVQAAPNWDYDDASLELKNGLVYDAAGNPVTGKVKADLYSHYIIMEFVNGKLVEDAGELYNVNDNLVGSIRRKADGSIESDNVSKELLDEIGKGVLEGNNLVAGTQRYVFFCASEYAKMTSPDGSGKMPVLKCSDLVKSYQQKGIGKPEDYSVSQKKVGNKSVIVVNTAFIPLKYRSAISKSDPSVGMTVQVQKSGNALVSFEQGKLK